MKRLFLQLAWWCCFFCAANVFAQASNLYLPINIQKAYQHNTRAFDGKPGANYWQNRANYSIKVNFDPKSSIVKGSETIEYFNNSPDELPELSVHLFPNLYKKGNSRDFNVEFADESNGVTIEQLKINGQDIEK